MYYVDCACKNHDDFKEFSIREMAETHFEERKCPQKILYCDEFNGTLKIIKESKGDNNGPISFH